ncbi:MAG TPA: SGNH/GDSL hydrolase family protein [Solirubrobacteraceae bacterium]
MNLATRPLVLALLAICFAAGSAADAAGQGIRRVVITGDSVTESSTLAPDLVHSQGLDGSLLSALRKRGVAASDGYLRSHGTSLHDGVAAVVVGPLHYDGQWGYAQTAGGPDGYASVTVTPGAAVSFPPGTRRLRLFFTGSIPRVYYRGKQLPIGASDIVTLPDARARVKLVNTGNLVFDGVMRYPTSGISLDVLGHAAALAQDNLDPGEAAQLRLLAPTLTIILFGTVEEFEESNGGLTPHTAEADFVNGLRERARIAHASGTCVFVSHTPNAIVGPGIQARFRVIEKEQAKRDGCAYSNILANAFGPLSEAGKSGLTIDTIHPTPAGYLRMAALLAKLIVPVPGKIGG